MIYNNTHIISTYNDRPLADEIKNILSDEGLYCEIGQTTLHRDELDDVIKNLKSFDAFIVIWSESCAGDVISNALIAKAVSLNTKLIVVTIDDYPFPNYLKRFKHFNYNDSEFTLKIKNELGVNLSEDRKLTYEHREECLKKYKNDLQNECGYLKILGSGNKVPISEVYLPLYIKSVLSPSQPINAENLLDITSTRIVVLGNPGTGKTTLLKYLSSKSISKHNDMMPFFIRISELMKTSSHLYDYIVSILKLKITKPCADLITKDESFCRSPKTLILLDGLDEVSTVEQQEFYSRLNTFLQNFPECKTIISSRFNGYNREHFSGFEEFQIEQLREIDIENYIWKVCNEDDKRNQIWSIVRSDSRLLELSKTPFLLAMICALPSPLGNRAHQRALLFQQCTQYLLRHVDWEAGRPVVNEDTAKILESALKTIAVRFFKLDRKDTFDKQELIFILGRMSGNTLNLSPSEILKLICENSGLLQMAGSTYHFIHRSIWEYFVALGMFEDSIDSIFERTNIAAWEEPIRIYVGLSPERDLKDILSGIWKNNKGLALRCMMEVETFPEGILSTLFNDIDKQERLSVVRKLREDINIISSPLDARRVLLDTLTALLRVEKDCEVIFYSIELLSNYSQQQGSCKECEQLISNTLDLTNANKRRKRLLDDKSYKLEFVCIPAGKFIMGKNDLSSTPEEKPEHPVKLSSYCIGKYPVTNKIYYEGSNFPFAIDKREGRSNKDNQPVIFITWYEAVIFARWLGCDLPTEAEWEYACRVGGQEDDVLYHKEGIAEYAWFVENSNNQTHEVGLKKPNAFGLYDMIGNVREWCKDWFDANYYAECEREGEVENPQGPETGTGKVLRGGCFDWNWANLVPTYRNYNLPSNSYFVNGFRLVLRETTVTQTTNI